MNAAIQPAHGRTRAERHAGPQPERVAGRLKPPLCAQILSLPAVSCGVLRCAGAGSLGCASRARPPTRILRCSRTLASTHLARDRCATPFTLPFTLPSPPRTHTSASHGHPGRPRPHAARSLPPPHRCGRCGPSAVDLDDDQSAQDWRERGLVGARVQRHAARHCRLRQSRQDLELRRKRQHLGRGGHARPCR